MFDCFCRLVCLKFCAGRLYVCIDRYHRDCLEESFCAVQVGKVKIKTEFACIILNIVLLVCECKFCLTCAAWRGGAARQGSP